MRSLSTRRTGSPWRGLTIFISISIACLLFFFVVGKVFQKKDYFGQNKIAIIRIEGVISQSEKVIEQLKKYEHNPSVKALVLRVNSPGGGVAPSQEIYQEIKRITDKGILKVVVSMGSVAASGGYYISCPADLIVANPGSLTGSLGVIMEFPYIEELLKKVGFQSRAVKSGVYKDIGSPFRNMKESEKMLLQAVIDDVYEQFVDAIAQGRDLSHDAVKKLAQGQIFSGRQAQALGLVDVLGSMETALEQAAQLADLDFKTMQLLEEKKEYDFSQILRGASQLFHQLEGAMQTNAPLMMVWR